MKLRDVKWSDVVFGCLLCCALIGCGRGGSSAATALQEYAEALRDGDVDQAYEMMSAEFRGHHSRSEFAQMLKDNAAETKETAQRLSAAKGQASIRAQIRYGLDETMLMVQEDGAWRIDSNPLAFYSQKSPRDAVRSFVRAYTLKRWKIMLRFVPSAYREHMTVEMVQKQFEGPRKEAMLQMMEKLRVNLNAPSSEMQKGNQARLRYGDDYEVELVREQGDWKIKHL